MSSETLKTSYSSIPESKIVSSFKRFVNEKRKNLLPNKSQPSNSIQPPNVRENPLPSEINDPSITFQSQIISCYYTIDDAKQEEFWTDVQNNLSNFAVNDPDQFYYDILGKISEYFGITRNSKFLEKFLLDQVIYAYNDIGDRIYVKDILRFDDSQHVVQGFLTKNSPSMCTGSGEDELWIVKWNVDPEVGEELTSNAFEKWDKIKNIGAETPKFYNNFYILDFPVIVMENLEPLEPTDYNQKLVLSIVSYIEKIISVGVNNNIKPSNIMKRSKGVETYIVVDVEKMTTEEKDYGYKRFSWSPDWASQVVDSNTITTVKNDLLEFGYTLNYLSKLDQISDASVDKKVVEQVRISEMPEELQRWTDRVRLIDEQDIKLADFIDLKKLSSAFPSV